MLISLETLNLVLSAHGVWRYTIVNRANPALMGDVVWVSSKFISSYLSTQDSYTARTPLQMASCLAEGGLSIASTVAALKATTFDEASVVRRPSKANPGSSVSGMELDTAHSGIFTHTSIILSPSLEDIEARPSGTSPLMGDKVVNTVSPSEGCHSDGRLLISGAGRSHGDSGHSTK
ncbi:hypothetical protein HWV62_15591 [Athelia sp. TMB]|nr:hypothetical protein HWV62_15591 [Athelia sp. TMB]